MKEIYPHPIDTKGQERKSRIPKWADPEVYIRSWQLFDDFAKKNKKKVITAEDWRAHHFWQIS